MKRASSVFAILVCSACKCGKTETPPPPVQPPPVTKAPEKPKSPPFRRAELEGTINLDPKAAAKTPAVALGPDLSPVVAWVESNAVHVKQWTPAPAPPSGQLGTTGTWNVVGGGPVTTKNALAPRVAVATDGTISVMFVEMNKDDKMEVRLAQAEGGAWTRAGDAANAPLAGNANQPALLLTPSGPVVAWSEASWKDPTTAVRARRFDGAGWQDLGGLATLVTDASVNIREPVQLAAMPSGAPALLWKEKKDGYKLVARAWEPLKNEWITLPSPEGVDGDSTLALSSGDGVLYLAMSWNAGLRPIQFYAPGALTWAPMGLPLADLESKNGYVSDQRMAGSALVLSTAGHLFLAHADDRRWSVVDDHLNVQPNMGKEAAIAGPTTGPLAVAWIDSSLGTAIVRVTAFVR